VNSSTSACSYSYSRTRSKRRDRLWSASKMPLKLAIVLQLIIVVCTRLGCPRPVVLTGMHGAMASSSTRTGGYVQYCACELQCDSILYVHRRSTGTNVIGKRGLYKHWYLSALPHLNGGICSGGQQHRATAHTRRAQGCTREHVCRSVRYSAHDRLRDGVQHSHAAVLAEGE